MALPILVLFLLLGANSVLPFQSPCALQKKTKPFFVLFQSTTATAHQAIYNITDNDSTSTRNDSGNSESRPTKITRPKSLSFFTGIRFLVASAKGQGHIFLNKLREEHDSDAFIIWNKYVTLTDASAIRDVLERYNLPKTEMVQHGYKFFFGPRGSILSAPWEEWKVQRRMTNNALAESSIGSLEPRLVQGIIPLLELLEEAAVNGTVVEMDQAFQAVSTDIIGLVIFGKYFGIGHAMLNSNNKIFNENDKEDLGVSKAMDLMKVETLRQIVMPKLVLKLRGPSKKVLAAKSYLDNLLEECIQERLQKEKTEKEQQPIDLLEILLESYERGTITREEVKGQLLTFLFAGQDTTAHTLSWMLYEISQNKTLQEELAQDMKEAFPRRNDTSYASATVLKSPHFSKLDRTFSETLRLYPAAATGTARAVPADAPLVVGNANLELPAGTSINIPPYSLHRNPTYWPVPERFDPDRFLPEHIKSRDPMTFQTFSAGPRNCIGSRLARMEALAIMSALLRRFSVTCVEENLPPKQFGTLTMKPKDGIHFAFERRE